MPEFTITRPSVTTTAGGTTTTDIDTSHCYAVLLQTASTMTSSSATIQTELTSSGTAWATLQSAGVDVEAFGGKAMVLHPIPFRRMRVVTAGAEAAAITWQVGQVIRT